MLIFGSHLLDGCLFWLIKTSVVSPAHVYFCVFIKVVVQSRDLKGNIEMTTLDKYAILFYDGFFSLYLVKVERLLKKKKANTMWCIYLVDAADIICHWCAGLINMIRTDRTDHAITHAIH